MATIIRGVSDRRIRVSALATILIAALFIPHGPARAATITVDTTADDSIDNGNCTLREAIIAANTNAVRDGCAAGQSGADRIAFDIPGKGLKTISPLSVLPSITGPVTIDGYTQRPCAKNRAPCSRPNALKNGTNASLLIELRGVNLAQCDCGGLQVNATAPGTVIRGLVINRFPFRGVFIIAAHSARIEGNFIGTNATGTLSRPNLLSDGIASDGANNVTIGGLTPATRNLISGNGQEGVHARGTGIRIEGNLIGTDRTGREDLGNASHGVEIDIGTGNTIGGDQKAAENVIAFNRASGVSISSSNATGNSIKRNSIFANVGVGIDLTPGAGLTENDLGDADDGGNRLQNFPLMGYVKRTKKGTTVSAQLHSTAHTTFTIRYFANPAGDEGKRFLGQMTVNTVSGGNSGAFVFKTSKRIGSGHTVTATATDPSGNTSELSKPIEADV